MRVTKESSRMTDAGVSIRESLIDLGLRCQSQAFFVRGLLISLFTSPNSLSLSRASGRSCGDLLCTMALDDRLRGKDKAQMPKWLI